MANFLLLGPQTLAVGFCTRFQFVRSSNTEEHEKIKDCWQTTKVYRAVVLSALLYGAETWTICQSQVKKLHAYTMRHLREIMNNLERQNPKRSDSRESWPSAYGWYFNSDEPEMARSCREDGLCQASQAAVVFPLTRWKENRSRMTWVNIQGHREKKPEEEEHFSRSLEVASKGQNDVEEPD